MSIFLSEILSCHVGDGCCVRSNFGLFVRRQKLSEVPEQTTNAGSFTVSGKLVPSYITVRTAEKILFVGESVHMFSSQGRPLTSSHDIGKFTCLHAAVDLPV